MFMFNNYLLINERTAISIPKLLQHCKLDDTAEMVPVENVEALEDISDEELLACFVSSIA